MSSEALRIAAPVEADVDPRPLLPPPVRFGRAVWRGAADLREWLEAGCLPRKTE